MTTSQIGSQLQRFLKTLPPLDYAFAYGSAVQPQVGYDDKKRPMVDLIIAVDDSQQWHKDNLAKNSKHYSGFGYLLGSRYIKTIETEIFPISFSPFIGFEELNVKYGVTQTKTLCQDLQNWNWLSLAGRMQKPILELQESCFTADREDRLSMAQQMNLRAAFATCLLLDYRPIISQDEHLYNVMSLSYIGDVRFTLGGENQEKVANILKGNYDKIQALYNNFIQNDVILSKIVKIQGDNYKINTSDTAKAELISLVPYGLIKSYSGSGKNMHLSLTMSQYLSEDLLEMIRRKNQYSSQRMLIAHLLTVSPLLNAKYAFQKLKRRYNK